MRPELTFRDGEIVRIELPVTTWPRPLWFIYRVVDAMFDSWRARNWMNRAFNYFYPPRLEERDYVIGVPNEK